MFYIPVENYDRLEKKFGKIKNKGGTLNLVKGDPVVLAVGENGFADLKVQRGTPAWDRSLKHKFYPIEVEGKYEIPGWRFIATIEHTPGGNIIRNITDEKIPEKYYDISPECEHCHRIRDRKDTYLVQNTDTGEFKQVGKSCLRDYTGGMDAALAASMAEWVKEPEAIKGIEDDLMVPKGSSGLFFDADKFKRIAYNYVKEHGYSKDPDYIYNIVSAYEGTAKDSTKPATAEELKTMDEWVLNLDTTTNDYYRNAFIAWNLEDLENRHLRLVASLINTYFKDKEKKKQQELARATTKHVGEIGDKVVVTVASKRLLYMKSFYSGYRTEETPVYRIVGEDGNIYIWSTQVWFAEGDTILATVKSHSEYNGEAQTVLTRGKVIDKETGKPLEKRFRQAKTDYQDLWDKLYGMNPSREDMKSFPKFAPGDDLDEPTKALTDWYEKQAELIKAKISELSDKEIADALLYLDEE